MIKGLLFFVLVLLNTQVFSQFSITSTDLAPLLAPGTAFYGTTSGPGQMDVGTPSSTAQNWLLPSTVIFTDTSLSINVTVAEAPMNELFTGATHCQRSTFSDDTVQITFYNFYRLTPEALVSVGNVFHSVFGQEDTTIATVETDTLLRLPVTLGLSYTQVDTIQSDTSFFMIRTSQITYDAYGQITLHDGTYDAIRSVRTANISIFIDDSLFTSYRDAVEIEWFSLHAILTADLDTTSATSGLVDVTGFDLTVFGNAPVSVREDKVLADGFRLEQNYPNPFNPVTTITYELKQPGYVSLEIYDMLGKQVARLVNGNQHAGEYSIKFDAANLPSGMYFYRLNSSGSTLTRKMMLLK